MGYDSIPHQFSSSKQFFLLLYIFIFLLLVVISMKQGEWSIPLATSTFEVEKKLSWFEVITKGINNIENIKIGLVNLDQSVDSDIYQQLSALQPRVTSVPINFDHVNGSLKWLDFYPQ
ncbi:hypothetical protein Lalb_Chr18g0045601 [Lupinus albus]|uniref:Uncharacterized protein n=1 Tax=Lupinus albus TaxID=3870 RepID=A0A6A4P4W5_LUPAL|nr:hypothetical protein Lalb_Chr18g0045601 [Lupinus albus]